LHPSMTEDEHAQAPSTESASLAEVPLLAPPVGGPPAGSPRRPHGLRHQGARPQSTRFLKETLAKLSHDSVRVGRKLVGDGGYESPAACSRSPSPPLAGLRGETPLALPEQAEFLSSWSYQAQPGESPEGWRGSRGETPSTTIGVEGLISEKLGPIECGISDVRNAMLAVANVISTWARDTSKSANMWTKHMDEQYERYSANNDRWDALQQQVAAVQAQLERVDSRLQERAEATDLFSEEQRQTTSRIEGTLQHLGHGLQEAGQKSEQRSTALERALAERSDAVTASVRKLIYGEEREAGSAQAVEPQLQAIQKGLQELVAFSREDVTQWQSTANKWQSAQELAASEVELAKKRAVEVQQDVDKLKEEAVGLIGRLEEVKKQVEESAHAPAGTTFEALRGVEKRGRVRLDRQSGLVEVPHALDFAAVKVGTPTVDWKDPEAAVEALRDIAELQQLFDGPVLADVRLRPGKGGKPEFWDKVAAMQADFFKEELSKNGIPELMLMAQGQQITKNMDPGIFVTLKRDIFDAAAAAALAPGAGDAGKKPAGKR